MKSGTVTKEGITTANKKKTSQESDSVTDETIRGSDSFGINTLFGILILLIMILLMLLMIFLSCLTSQSTGKR